GMSLTFFSIRPQADAISPSTRPQLTSAVTGTSSRGGPGEQRVEVVDPLHQGEPRGDVQGHEVRSRHAIHPPYALRPSSPTSSGKINPAIGPLLQTVQPRAW